MSFLEISVKNGACLDDLNPAFGVIPKEQLYDVLLAHRLPTHPTTRAEAFARIEAAFCAMKLAEEHHVRRCVELLLGGLLPTVTGKPLPVSGMTGYLEHLMRFNPGNAMLEGFRDMKSLWDPANSTAIRQRRKHGFCPGLAPVMGNGLRSACLTLLMGWLQWLSTMMA
jgi:hypothetical protein